MKPVIPEDDLSLVLVVYIFIFLPAKTSSHESVLNVGHSYLGECVPCVSSFSLKFLLWIKVHC